MKHAVTTRMKALFAGALLLLGGCTGERPAPVAATPAVARPALWAVRDADTTIYLFGTVHVLKPGTRWFERGVKSAFDSADELVTEIIEPDNPAEMAAIMGAKAMATDGVPLSERIAPDKREPYKVAMTANGLPWAAFERMEPWMAGMMLSVAPLDRLGYKAEAGAEKTLRAAALAAGKKMGALETVEQQIGYFDTLPVDQQVAFLDATVEGLPDVEGDFAKLIDHWARGEPDKLAAEMNESLEATPELASVLLFERNARWAQWIKARMARPGTVFVAVGAGHLAGKGSLQDQLATLGLRAHRVMP